MYLGFPINMLPRMPRHNERWAYPPCAAPEGVNAQMSDTKEFVTGFVGILIMVVIFFALIGTILDQIANTTLTGAALALVNLLPVLLAIALVLVAVSFAIQRFRGGE